MVIYDGDTKYYQLHRHLTYNVVSKGWKTKVSLQSIVDLLKYLEKTKDCVVLNYHGYNGGQDVALKVYFNAVFLFLQAYFLQSNMPFCYKLYEYFKDYEKIPSGRRLCFTACNKNCMLINSWYKT